MSDKKKSRMEELFQQGAFFQALLDSLDSAIYIFDANGKYVFLNKTAEDFEGLRNKDVYGKHIRDIYSHPDCSPSLKALETGQHVKDDDNVYMIGGKRFRQMVNAYPVTENGEVIGCYTVSKDITSLEKIVSENISHQTKIGHSQKNIEFSSLIGSDKRFVKCIETASNTAGNDLSIMLLGATGTGKEMFAKGIHNASPRKHGPFVAVNCGAIPETLLESILFGTEKGAFTGAVDKKGVFEQARGGTIFLDELNSMPLESQVKLLRVLEENEIRHVGGGKDIKTDVRVISAMSISSQEAIASKRLREDLFYRLSVINISIPPLAERGEDVFLLSEYFIDKYNRKFDKHVNGLSEEVRQFFSEYDWPGNVRQLKHALESVVSLSGAGDGFVSMEDLPPYLLDKKEYIKLDVVKNKGSVNDSSNDTRLTKDVDVYETIRSREQENIVEALFSCNGNVTKAAELLGIHRQSLIYKMKKYGIKRK